MPIRKRFLGKMMGLLYNRRAGIQPLWVSVHTATRLLESPPLRHIEQVDMSVSVAAKYIRDFVDMAWNIAREMNYPDELSIAIMIVDLLLQNEELMQRHEAPDFTQQALAYIRDLEQRVQQRLGDGDDKFVMLKGVAAGIIQLPEPDPQDDD